MSIKMIIAALAVSMAGVAHADSVTVLYGKQSTTASPSVDSNVYKLNYKKSFTKTIDGDISILNTVGEDTNKISSRYELGVSQKHDFNEYVSGYVRGAVGEKVVSGTADWLYYSVEPGVVLTPPLPVEGISFKLAYRYRNAFNTANDDRTNSVRYAANYAFTKQDKVTLGYDDVYGDGAFDRIYISYTKAF